MNVHVNIIINLNTNRSSNSRRTAELTKNNVNLKEDDDEKNCSEDLKNGIVKIQYPANERKTSHKPMLCKIHVNNR